MLGGWKDAKNADDNVQTQVDRVRSDVETQAGNNFDQFKAVSYKSQVVAGMNYKVKVQVSDTGYVHVQFFVPLPSSGGNPEVKNVETGKTLEDPL